MRTLKNSFYLIPIDGRKSFYNKATVNVYNNDEIELKSYNTIVCRIKNGKLYRTWNGYSITTMRHVNAFLNAYGMETINKKQWEQLEISI